VLAVYRALEEELALYENGQFVPFLTREILEGILTNPAAFTLQRFRLDTVSTELFRRYAKAITGEVPDHASLLSALKPLAKFMVELPDYTKRTKRLSTEAIAIRELFFASKTPAQLVFVDLPKACGIESINGPAAATLLEAFSEKFGAALTELRVAYHGLLGDIQEMIKRVFALESKLLPHEVRETLRGRCSGLEHYTIDLHGLKAFIGRISDPYGDENQWLVSLATFLARKPPEKWADEDFSAVEYRLTEFASRLRDLWRLQLHFEDVRADARGDIEAALVRVISTSKGAREGLVALDKKGQRAIRERYEGLRKALEVLPSDELRLAALALLADELLSRQADKASEEGSDDLSRGAA
jgi:hypothetical protein